jgi:hypothetical protein
MSETLLPDPEEARLAELKALAGVLPYHRRDELSSPRAGRGRPPPRPCPGRHQRRWW